eukprot:TRINITY_DN4200_c1_g3_i2.p1 TRINITY_DN4200_c1_g3~~TRINITY_DN4200_c1_g3_i2.p1  ORF type:complete len:594 (-),score=82.98 TRINITY_DN4200_c1_g3_i2:194-1975(-)
MTMEVMVRCQKLCQVETRKLVLIMGIIGTAILVSQSFTLPFRNVFLSLSPAVNITLLGKGSSQSEDSSLNATLERVRDPYGVYRQERGRETENVSSPERISVDFLSPPVTLSPTVSFVNGSVLKKLDIHSSNPVMTVASSISSRGKQITDILPKGEPPGPLQSGLVTLNSSSTMASCTVNIKQQALPPTPISEMNHILLRSRVSSCAMRPRWSSKLDRQLLSVKALIENAPIVENDRELYSLVFRNVSRFKRSYEMMESIFKVYIYREGEKPIFHQPLLKGIYSSEGWFMKQMEGNSHFVVKDPRKAHMFYLPFGSRNLKDALYVRRSFFLYRPHSMKNLVEYLKDYVDMIAAKYPFWNRTGGSDHFLVACHDWAPAETRHNMEWSIRAICNTDLSQGFKIGKDVSLPTTNVRFPRNPLRDVGGKPASQRTNLAFFSGNMHGSLRPILLQHWENKDPVMKIFGPMKKKKPSYAQFMKTSKYCICPKGYEVHSPRVVEAIFYECVPVIISDNYVPPFFEFLDWEAFSVIVAEKDIPLLKDILLSIPEEKYLTMQLRVKKVQQHFLWHNKPVKYDLFHMILHSIWFNRVHQVKIR